MILFPAIDIKGQQCVRLRQGQANESTVFSNDPVAMAGHWQSQGARWLHIVDLDGAFQGNPVNFDLIKAICGKVSIPVQLGGGIRDKATAANYFQAGVARLIIGTMALEDKTTFTDLCRDFPGRIGISLDADQGRLKSRGWVKDSGMVPEELLPELEDMGAAFIIYTDISRDGMQTGVNVQGTARILRATNLPVIAAGGVTHLQDIQELASLNSLGLAGIITGKAIYSKTLDFREAQLWLDQNLF